MVKLKKKQKPEAETLSGAFPVPTQDEKLNDKNMWSWETLSNYPLTPSPPSSLLSTPLLSQRWLS